MKSQARVISIIAVICFIAAFVFGIMAFHKYAHYKNPDYGTTVNAYVGGDAYNYIINGTYFTGFSILAGMSVLAGLLCILIHTVMLQNEERNEMLAGIKKRAIHMHKSIESIDEGLFGKYDTGIDG